MNAPPSPQAPPAPAPPPPPQIQSKTPADFLKSIKGKPVVVKLNSGVDYRGVESLRVVDTQSMSKLVAFT